MATMGTSELDSKQTKKVLWSDQSSFLSHHAGNKLYKANDFNVFANQYIICINV